MQLASLFGPHAVLQQGQTIPVWGWTRPMTRVRVHLGEATACGKSGEDGKFMVRLPALPAGGPHTLRVEVDDGTVDSATVEDILVGEVWLASGQSNMQWNMSMLGECGEEDIRQAEDTELRFFAIPNVTRLGRQARSHSEWKVCTPTQTAYFSAVAYYFARKLRKELGVPVGVIQAAWGGTIVEAWTAREWLARNPYTTDWLARYDMDVNAPANWETPPGEKNRSGIPSDPGNRGKAEGWANPDLDLNGWSTIELPKTWQAAGHAYSGVFWFRKTVDLPANWADKDLDLGIGAVDKHDVTYFNGEQVGTTGHGFEQEHWSVPRNYRVPGNLVKAGKNTIAVRAYSFVYNGGMIGPASSMKISVSGRKQETLELTGNWNYREEHNLGLVTPIPSPMGLDNPNSPHILFDSMINPLIPYGLRGAIWYQGESNANKAHAYHSLFRDMIRNWRLEWGQGDFPFLFVQLANYKLAQAYDPSSEWARLREAQLHTLSEPATGMAVAIDLGEAMDIHPRNKKDIGLRLARWALARTYDRHTACSGPIYRSMKIEGSRIRLEFEHTAGGLQTKDDKLKGFYICDMSRTFLPAEAVIDGNTVVVSSPEAPEPIAVRYAWADNPEGCNLYNRAGLPASPFRTDNYLV